MNNLIKLKNDLENKAQEEYETNADNFIEGELTEEDRDTLDQLKQEVSQQVVVSEENEDGLNVQQPISEFAKSLDNRIAEIKDAAGNSEVIKTLNSGDIVRTTEQLKADAKKQALRAYRELSINKSAEDSQQYTDEDYLKINDNAISELMNYFKLDRLTTDAIMPRLNKMTLSQICAILPDDFVEIYVTDNERRANNLKGKERLLAAIGYLTVTGPEMDYLNEYIENENKLALVSQRIFRSQLDVTEMLKDEKTLSELVSKTIKLAPNDKSFWGKYIAVPNKVHNEFAQRAVLQQMYKAAYEKLLTEYPEDGPDQEFNQKARAVIQEEIDEAANKEKVYLSITDLELLKELCNILTERYMHHTKLTQKFLEKECISAIDRARKCKQDVPYPGYKGNMKKPEMIYKAYMTAYPAMVGNYNKSIMEVYKREMDNTGEQPETEIEAIYLPNVDPKLVAKTFALLLSILMGRVMKKCTENSSTKYDAIVLDSYFQMFCKLGTDIYSMNAVWLMLKPLVQYVIETVKPKW